ncbi:MAG: type 4a pilus biogenesis protein PilO [Phycisphaerae bacterium]
MRHAIRDNWIVLGIAVAMTLTAILGVYARQGRKLDELQARMVAQRARLESESQKVAIVPEMIRQVQALKNRYSGFDRKLPKSKELSGFLKEISSCVSQMDLTNQSIEPLSPTRQEHFNTLPIKMKFHGTYLSLAAFLDQVERMERLSRVQKLTIAGGEKGSELDIELQMNIYFTES